MKTKRTESNKIMMLALILGFSVIVSVGALIATDNLDIRNFAAELYPRSGNAVPSGGTGSTSYQTSPTGASGTSSLQQASTDNRTGYISATPDTDQESYVQGAVETSEDKDENYNPYDLNGDGGITLEDYNIFMSDYTKFRDNGTYYERSDFNGDLAIDMTDYDLFMDAYNASRLNVKPSN